MDEIPENRIAAKDAILIAGPTASGKTALAVELAQRHDGLVINADSMQVYDILHVLTARPSNAELAAAPHVLFGHVSPLRAYSTGEWMRDVLHVLDTELDGRRPVFVGGTGLYFKALLGGLSDMPHVPDEVREAFRSQLMAAGPEAMHALLARRDPETARSLHPQDGQRILRALEVMEASGQPIGFWQARRRAAIIDPASARRIILQPEREVLRHRIAGRFHAMVEQGAVQEVERLLSLSPDPSLPAMKAIGVPEIASVLRGEQEMADAVAAAITATRQYAKRQMTWFRNQMDGDWERIPVS